MMSLIPVQWSLRAYPFRDISLKRRPAGRRRRGHATVSVETLRLAAATARSARLRVPGDKSITHRALLLGAIARGRSLVLHPNQGADVLATYRALRQLGVRLERRAEAFVVYGVAGFRDPRSAIDCGNSGTTLRLLMGLLAGRVNARLTGDASLRRRPLERVAIPLRAMGARITTSAKGTAPVKLYRANQPLQGLAYRLPVASAQLKSALLLAGLQARGRTTLLVGDQSRDHTERLLRSMGAKLSVRAGRIVLLPGALNALSRITIPGDISSAFFLLAAAARVPGAKVQVQDVGLNPTRTAALAVLREMGASLSIRTRRAGDPEPAGDISVTGGGDLHGVTVRPSSVPNLIDEIPALCAVAATAQGTFVVRGARELRVKESDRIATTVRLLRSFAVDAYPLADGIAVRGGAALRPPRRVRTNGDHRIGMAAAILAAAAGSPLVIEDAECIATSFPGFRKAWRSAFG